LIIIMHGENLKLVALFVSLCHLHLDQSYQEEQKYMNSYSHVVHMRFPPFLKCTVSSVLWFSLHCILASAHNPVITCCYCLLLPSSSSSLQCQMRVLHQNQSSKKEPCSVPFFCSHNAAEYVFLLSSLLLHDFNLTSTNQWL